ncbi:MAG: tetratricopeptide repeat protein [Pseudobdellovibrionaceae bacterium]
MKEYLVKSSSKVMGPFSEEELVELLIHNQISLLDEIKKPSSRWIYLREDKHFREVIEKVRNQIDQTKEDTESSTFGSTITNRISDDLTPTPAPRQPINIAADSRDKIESMTAPPVQIKNVLHATERISDLKTKSLPDDISSQERRMHFGTKILASVLFVGMAYLLVARYQGNFSKNPLDQFYKALAFKQNQAALSSYQAMNTQDRMNIKVKKAVLPLIANFDQGNPEVRDSLMQLIQSVDDRKEKSVFANSVGISFLHEQKWGDAEKYFLSAIKYDEFHLAAKINLVTLKLLSGQTREALMQYKNILLSNSLSLGGTYFNTPYLSYLQYAFAYAFYKEFAQQNLEERKRAYNEHRQVIAEINKNFQSQIFLSFEMSYLQFLIQLEFVQDQIEQQFREFLPTILNDGNMFYKSPDLFWEIADWKLIRDFCNETSLKALQVSLFKTICYLKSNQEAEAEQSIRENILLFPKEKDAQLTYAVYLIKVGKYSEAKAQSALVLKSDSSNQLARKIQGKICIELSEESCSRPILRDLLSTKTGSIGNWVDLYRLDGEKIKYEFPLENLNAIDRQTYLPYVEIVMKEKN